MAISPARPKGPPLNALRAFEAAARLGGFAAAAEELCVTPAAVAQQIKSLEAWTGARLFERRSQGVQLSALGHDVFGEFRDAFDRLGEATLALRQRATPDIIRIAALPSIAQLWLSPRLPQIRSAMPDVTISVTALETPPNLKREPFDLALFFEDLPISSNSIEICRDVIYPVCAPSLAAKLKRAADLKSVTLIHDATWSSDWTNWLSNVVPQAEIEVTGPTYSLYALALEEAKNGAGVLIGHDHLVRDAIEAGDLVAPFKKQVKQRRCMTLSVPDKSNLSAPLRTVLKRFRR